MKSDRALFAAAILAIVFLAGTLVPPLAPSARQSWAGALRMVYAPLCHQLPARSLHVAGGPMAVCARCAGASTGAALGLTLAAWGGTRIRRGRLAWLTVAATPGALDVAARLLGAAGAGNLVRATISLPVGLVAGLLLAEGIEDLARMLEDGKRPAAWSAAPAGETSR